MQLSPIDNPVIEAIREIIENSHELEEHGHAINLIISSCNRVQSEELKERILSLCFMDSEAFTDEQCIQLVSNFILSL